MRENAGEGTKHQYVNTAPDYISFGHGKHAWYGFFSLRCRIEDDVQTLRSPGRFFAANELKALVAFLVLNYDFKLAGDGKEPKNVYSFENVIPDPTAQLMFRKRQPAPSA